MIKHTAFQYISGIINKLIRDQKIGFKSILDANDAFIKNRFVSWIDTTTLPGFSIAYEYMNHEEEVNAAKGNKRIAIHITRLDLQRGSMLIEYDSKTGPQPTITVLGTTDLEYMHEWHRITKTYAPMIADAITTVNAEAITFPYTLTVVRG